MLVDQSSKFEKAKSLQEIENDVAIAKRSRSVNAKKLNVSLYRFVSYGIVSGARLKCAREARKEEARSN